MLHGKDEVAGSIPAGGSKRIQTRQTGDCVASAHLLRDRILVQRMGRAGEADNSGRRAATPHLFPHTSMSAPLFGGPHPYSSAPRGTPLRPVARWRPDAIAAGDP